MVSSYQISVTEKRQECDVELAGVFVSTVGGPVCGYWPAAFSQLERERDQHESLATERSAMPIVITFSHIPIAHPHQRQTQFVSQSSRSGTA